MPTNMEMLSQDFKHVFWQRVKQSKDTFIILLCAVLLWASLYHI